MTVIKETTIQIQENNAKDNINRKIINERSPIVKIKRILCLFFIVVILISIARIPFTGAYIDGYCFEVAFGFNKYIIYAYILTLLITKFFNFKLFNILTSKRIIISLILFLISSTFIYSCVVMWFDYANNIKTHNFVDQMNNYISHWLSYSTCNSYQQFIISDWTFGINIFGQLIIAIWEIFSVLILSILGLVMLLVCLSFIFYKKKIIGLNGVRKLFIRILGGKVTEPLNEFVVHKNDVTPTPISVQNIELEATNREQLTPPIHLLSDTSINNDFVNEDMAKKYNEKILKLLQNNDVVVTPLTIQTMPLFVEITFSLQNESDINKILSLRNELINALKNSVINITMKGNTLKFDIKNKQPSHVSIKSIIGDSGSIEPYTSVIGSTFNSQHLLLNFNTHNNCLIIGNEGSGAMMLFTSFIISLAYFNSPDNLKFLFLFPTVNKTLKSFNDLPHALKPIIYEKNKIFEELQLLKREIENRTWQNNNSQTLFVCISNTESLIFNGSNLNILIKDLLQNSKQTNIHFIILNNQLNQSIIENDFINKFDDKFIFKLTNELESISMFGNQKGNQLFGGGDGLWSSKTGSWERIQTCYLNAIEFEHMIKIIHLFHDFKNKNKISAL